MVNAWEIIVMDVPSLFHCLSLLIVQFDRRAIGIGGDDFQIIQGGSLK